MKREKGKTEKKQNLKFKRLRLFAKGGRLAKKFALLIFAILVIPILVIDIISISTAVNSVLNESKKSYLAATNSTASYFQLAFKTAQDNGMQLMSNELIQRLYSESKQSTLDEFQKMTLISDANKVVQDLLVANDMFAGIYIIVDKENSLYYPSLPFEINYEKLKKTPWYKKIMEAGGPILIESHTEEFDSVAKANNANMPEYAFSVGMPFKDIAINHTLGVMLLDISKKWMSDVLQDTQISQNGGYMLALCSSGNVILPTEWENTMKLTPDRNTQFVKKILQSQAAGKTNGAFHTEFAGKQFLITYSQVPDTNWTIVGMIPVSQLVEAARRLELIIVVLTILFTLIALVIGIYYALRIVRDLERVTKTFAVAEKGDLTVTLDIKRDDEIGLLSHSFNNMTKNIKDLIEKGVNLSKEVSSAISTLTTIASETAAASNEVAKAIQEIAEGAANQAKEATSVVEAVSKFGEKIDTIVSSAIQMSTLSTNVSQLSNKGTEVVNTLNNVTHETVHITDTMIQTINQLAEYSRSIGKIIQVLSGISEQTKLLALNASIEAAKAGEAGRGFAVVASEIRKLADQSKESTREVEDMIKKIVAQTKAAQEVADKVENVIDQQNSAVEDVASAFSNIKSAMDELIKGIENITESISAIDKEKDTIIHSIENISAISEETAASSQEVSASTQEQLAAIEELRAMTEQLNKLSQDLQAAMQIFKV
ncbi:methyl-accepting chemotaxis protein [Caldicellulosiruptor naganoensis]|uniref:Methyl-accepting chemotaxis protein n=1 Tax=Caldicellulosiruptor naganoensis TaxID=29324 RepID=A0ABY7BHS2_9FIRM|nr:methyl-accepting chemotaxis protein [Caldicellulosiruptor naganoensis]WAM31427.1 methyl-accepting chemotaxis protein [Caldicellulosiruptor naganoensis]